jgi:hypothetical protein
LPSTNYVISTGGGAFAAAVERPLYFALAVAFAYRTPQRSVISTEGGAFAAAAERPPYFAFAVVSEIGQGFSLGNMNCHRTRLLAPGICLAVRPQSPDKKTPLAQKILGVPVTLKPI